MLYFFRPAFKKCFSMVYYMTKFNLSSLNQVNPSYISFFSPNYLKRLVRPYELLENRLIHLSRIILFCEINRRPFMKKFFITREIVNNVTTLSNNFIFLLFHDYVESRLNVHEADVKLFTLLSTLLRYLSREVLDV